MATVNKDLPIGVWVNVSSADKVFAGNYNNVPIQAAWATQAPVEGFKPHIIPGGFGIARDFETGNLWLRNTAEKAGIKVTVDEG